MTRGQADSEAEAGSFPVNGLSDHSLLERFRNGSQEAATQLYARYAQRLRGLARAQMSPGLQRQVELDDLVQSVFGSFFRRAGNGFYDVPVGEELWGLFLVIALNKIRNQGAFHHAAKRDVRRTVAANDLAERAGDDGAAYATLRLAVEESLQRLPPAHREMVQLRIEGFEVAEIAEKTGRARRTVERILQEARGKLGGLLEDG